MANLESLGEKFRVHLNTAKNDGTVELEDDDGQIYVLISADLRIAGNDRPFNQSENLLRPPTARAAYSDRTAWLMAELSALAYLQFESKNDKHQKAQLLATLKEGGFTRTKFFNAPKTGTQAFLTVKPKAFAVLAFRGTEKDGKDIKTDLNARFYNSASGKSHRGFCEAYYSIEPEVREAIDAELKKQTDLPIFITGHSLGGALATVAAQELEEAYTISACYTFGSPRVGSAEWSDSLKTPVYRVVHGADGVPMVPPSALFRSALLWASNIPVLHFAKGPVERFVQSGFLGFQHAGDMRFIERKMETGVLKIGSAATFSRFSHVFFGMVTRIFKALSDAAKDHGVANYTMILKSIAKQRNT